MAKKDDTNVDVTTPNDSFFGGVEKLLADVVEKAEEVYEEVKEDVTIAIKNVEDEVAPVVEAVEAEVAVAEDKVEAVVESVEEVVTPIVEKVKAEVAPVVEAVEEKIEALTEPEVTAPVIDTTSPVGLAIADVAVNHRGDLVTTTIETLTTIMAKYVEDGVITDPSVIYASQYHAGYEPKTLKEDGTTYMYAITVSWVEGGVHKTTELAWD